MKRFWKAVALIGGSVLAVGTLAFLAYIAYRNVVISRALVDAEKFTPNRQANSRRVDPAPLQRLRPHPWSSPLHNRHFDEAIAGARAAYGSGDYDRAIVLNTEALQVQPSPDLVWLLLIRRAGCYLEKNDSDKALADYNEAERLGGLDASSYIDRARAWQQKSDLSQAMKDLDAAAADNPKDDNVYFYRGVIAADEGKFDDALQAYDKAVELNAKNAGARLNASRIRLRRNENERVITDATIALRIRPSLTAAYVIRAQAYAQLKMNSQATAELDSGLRLNTSDKASALNSVAWCRATAAQTALRDGKKAVKEATQACESTQWKTWGYIDTLAAAYAEAGDFENAIKYQQRAMEMAGAKNRRAELERRLELYRNTKPFRD
jgi:tetratricopeptide (TPR) repeat protein